MQIKAVFLLICGFAFATSRPDQVSSQTVPGFEPSAVASVHVDKHNFKSGEDIEVTVLLEGGPWGVYVPKWWGESGGGMSGFSVNLTTLSGTQAEACGHAADAFPEHNPDAAAVLNRDFIYLPAQHIIGLKTAIYCPTKQPGKYLINAFYSAYHIDAYDVARLPETHGRVLKIGVQAKPIEISIY
jgi:hypothetical protein